MCARTPRVCEAVRTTQQLSDSKLNCARAMRDDCDVRVRVLLGPRIKIPSTTRQKTQHRPPQISALYRMCSLAWKVFSTLVL